MCHIETAAYKTHVVAKTYRKVNMGFAVRLLSILIVGMSLFSPTAYAVDVPQSFTLDGQLFRDAAGVTPLVDSSILFKVQILDQNQVCVLYEEQQSINTATTQGYFTVQVGSALGSTRRTATDSGNTMALVFQNISTVPGKLLSNGNACTAPATAGDRRFVRISIAPTSMGGAERVLSPNLTIDSVPNAIVAERAETVQGVRGDQLLKVNTAAGSALSQSNLESLFTSVSRFNSLSAVVDGTSSNYVQSSSGGAKIPVLTGAPTSPAQGSVWFDSGDSRLKYYDGVNPISIGTGGGTVSSVGFTAPAELSVAGAPVTTSGTIAVTWATQTTGKVFAAPNGSTGVPTFRALVAADAPFAVVNLGGTPSLQSGSDASKGTAGTAGRVWIATDTKLIYRDTGTVWEQIGGSGAPSGTAGGDLDGTYPNPSVDAIRGVAISATAPNDGQVLKYTSTGTNWIASNFGAGDLKTAAGTTQFASASCTAAQTLTWSSLTNTFTCSNIAGLDAATITTGTIDAARLPASANPWSAATGGINYASGNVGVGNTAPAEALSVSGAVQVGVTANACSATNKGAIRYNNTTNVLEFCNGTSWNLVQAAACTDATPNVVSFSNQANAAVSSLYTSDIQLVNGINCSVPVSISGQGSPQFQICSDSGCSSVVQGWTSSPSSISSGQYLQTRLTTDTVGGAMFQSTIIVGSGATVWSVTNAGGDCTGSPSIGTVCADGTLYAGLTPDGGVKMFTTRCDFGQTWDGSNCTGSRASLQWNNGTSSWTPTGYTGTTTGKSNSAGIAALVDAGSPHAAAQNCENLNLNGNTDWYLPALGEVNVIYSSRAVIRNFDTSGNYWAATEADSPRAYIVRFSDGTQTLDAKNASNRVRCVRR